VGKTVSADIAFVSCGDMKPSYRDLFVMAEGAGFPAKSQAEIDFGADGVAVYTFFTCGAPVPAAASRKRKTVLWYLERRGGADRKAFRNFIFGYACDRNLDEVWFSDRALWRFAEVPGSRFVPVGTGAGRGLGPPSSQEKTYGCAHMSYISGPNTRREILRPPWCNWAPCCYGEARSAVLRQTKFMINVHRDEDAYFEPLRFALATAWGIPIISEQCADPFPFAQLSGSCRKGDFLVGATPADVQLEAQTLLAQPYEPWRQFGLGVHEKMMKDWNFRDNVLRVVEGRQRTEERA
jgi:hypothetical protein